MNKILKSGMMLAMALLAMSCNKEDLPGNGEEVNGGVLTINVVDKGYASQDSVPETKATTDGSYKTTFGEGDEIGVYVVSGLEGNQILLNNEKLTYSSSGWTGDLRYKKIEGDSPKFFAYYPYDGSISAEKITASAENAEGFFATYLTNIELPTDQSDAGKYSKADIMVGDGVLAGTALTFGMKHQMGLVVIEIPKKFVTGQVYYLEGDEDFTWPAEGYTESDVSSPSFQNGVTPLAVTPEAEDKYVYRYLVNPVASSKSAIQGSFSVGGSSKSYTIETTSFPTEGGKYKTYSVGLGAGEVRKVKYTPQVGDFYMNDGSLVSGSTTLSSEQKRKCIGIVFWTGDATSEDRILKAAKSGCTHGLVVAIDGDDTTPWQSSYSSYNNTIQSWLDSNKSGEFEKISDGTGDDTNLNKCLGYNNTKALEAFHDANSGYPLQIVEKLRTYQGSHAEPSQASDWFIPSPKELVLLCGGEKDNIYSGSAGTTIRDQMNTQLGKAGGTSLNTSYYWSSGEGSSTYAFNVNFSNGSVNGSSKGNCNRVRFVLAF